MTIREKLKRAPRKTQNIVARRKGYAITMAQSRAVWAAVSRHPTMPIRLLSQCLGMSHGRVHATLLYLEDIGYIASSSRAGSHHTRHVLVPLMEAA